MTGQMRMSTTASGAASSIDVSCPNCGANITVPLGMSRFCPYCGSKVGATVRYRPNALMAD